MKSTGKKFSVLISSLSHAPHKQIIKRMDSGMFPFDMNLVYNYKPEYLAYKEFNKCLELFKSRNTNVKLEQCMTRIAGIQQLIVKKEKPIRKQLEEIGISLIKEIYNIPDYINLKAIIRPGLDFNSEQDNNPKPFLELTLEQKNKMLDQIKKREVFIGLIHGSSMNIWKGLHHMIAEKINLLDPDLKELYNQYTASIGIALWFMNPDDLMEDIIDSKMITQGFSKVKFNRTQGFGANIETESINFPVMLHELQKGLMNYLFASGIPKEYSEIELEYYYSKADNHINEPYHYLLSPTLWVDLLETANINNDQIPRLISNLTQLSYNELVVLFRNIIDKKLEAKNLIDSWNL